MHFNSFTRLANFTKPSTFVSVYQVRKAAFKSQCHQLATGLIKNYVNITFRFTNCPLSHLGKVLEIACVKKPGMVSPAEGYSDKINSVYETQGELLFASHTGNQGIHLRTWIKIQKAVFSHHFQKTPIKWVGHWKWKEAKTTLFWQGVCEHKTISRFKKYFN